MEQVAGCTKRRLKKRGHKLNKQSQGYRIMGKNSKALSLICSQPKISTSACDTPAVVIYA